MKAFKASGTGFVRLPALRAAEKMLASEDTQRTLRIHGCCDSDHPRVRTALWTEWKIRLCRWGGQNVHLGNV